MGRQLRRTEGLQIRNTDDETLARYRRTGRQADELLNRPVQTTTRHGILHIALTDWGHNPLETHLDDARTRNAIDRAFPAHPGQWPQP
jgi:hypothetical protein